MVLPIMEGYGGVLWVGRSNEYADWPNSEKCMSGDDHIPLC